LDEIFHLILHFFASIGGYCGLFVKIPTKN